MKILWQKFLRFDSHMFQVLSEYKTSQEVINFRAFINRTKESCEHFKKKMDSITLGEERAQKVLYLKTWAQCTCRVFLRGGKESWIAHIEQGEKNNIRFALLHTWRRNDCVVHSSAQK